MRKILPISYELNFTRNTLGYYGLYCFWPTYEKIPRQVYSFVIFVPFSSNKFVFWHNVTLSILSRVTIAQTCLPILTATVCDGSEAEEPPSSSTQRTLSKMAPQRGSTVDVQFGQVGVGLQVFGGCEESKG